MSRQDTPEMLALRGQLQDLENEAQLQHERRERERRAAAQAEPYEAESWPEAFAKNIRRMTHELRLCERDAAAPDLESQDREALERIAADWRRDIETNRTAAAILAARMRVVDEAYQRACREALEATAAELDARLPGSAVSEALREGDPQSLLNW